MIHTPHVPHNWEAGLLFEEENRTLFSSDLFHQSGDVEALTESSVIERARKSLTDYQAGPFANYIPYTQHTTQIFDRLAELKPATLAIMHGSSFVGDGAGALRDLSGVIRGVLVG